MKPIRVAFKVNADYENRKVHLIVLDEHGDVRDEYVCSIGCAGDVSRQLADACSRIVIQHGSKLPDFQVTCVSGRH